MKRIVLFLVTNIAVGLVLTFTLSILGVGRYLAGTGLNIGGLAIFSVIVGFARLVHLAADVQADGEVRPPARA